MHPGDHRALALAGPGPQLETRALASGTPLHLCRRQQCAVAVTACMGRTAEKLPEHVISVPDMA
eukprot:200312-Rhodomonas_salina.1